MKKNLLLLLFCALSLTTHNRLSAMSPQSIITITEVVNHGGSLLWVAQAAATGAALGHLARFGVAELGIFAGLAVSLGIKKDTTLIRAGLTYLTTKAETIHQEIIANALKNSGEHKRTHDELARLQEQVKNGFDKQSNQLKHSEAKLIRHIHALQLKLRNGIASKTDIARLMQLQKRQMLLLENRLKRLEKKLDTNNAGITWLTELFK
ncbi:MAG: hypothetical protein K2X90_03475 [Candidatus Babeliaceae bacterium]|nr:hypothetical protein [Candidatus Babeliaceae bacterium]